jgi:hypothetical protein
MSMNRPLLICLTPVRNEAWILGAFLKATSLWADYIIIADQDSNDGSREIALSFSKVILIDNFAKEMHQGNTRRLLFNEAIKIKGEKIIFSLDADEFLSGDFMQTKGWKEIINSKPGELFWFKWINLYPNCTKYVQGEIWMYWACHYSDDVINGEFPDFYIHEWRLPYPKSEVNQTQIDDISFIHFARASYSRQKNKEKFYQVITKFNEPKKSIVSLYRMYNYYNSEKEYNVNESIYSFYKENGIDLLTEINLFDVGDNYKQLVIKYIEKMGSDYFQGLDIWDKSFLHEYNLNDPRSILIKLLHLYFRNTTKHSKTIIIRLIDKLLKLSGI